MARFTTFLALFAILLAASLALMPADAGATGVEKPRGKNTPPYVKATFWYGVWSSNPDVASSYSEWRPWNVGGKYAYLESRVQLNGGAWIDRGVVKHELRYPFVVRAKSSGYGDQWRHQVRVVDRKGNPVTDWGSILLTCN